MFLYFRKIPVNTNRWTTKNMCFPLQLQNNTLQHLCQFSGKLLHIIAPRFPPSFSFFSGQFNHQVWKGTISIKLLFYNFLGNQLLNSIETKKCKPHWRKSKQNWNEVTFISVQESIKLAFTADSVTRSSKQIIDIKRKLTGN